jgi:hypothetical protein
MAAPLLSAAKAFLDRLLASLPFAKRNLPSAPEPFSSIEDSTPNSDVLISPNAAPTFRKPNERRIDVRAAIEDLSRKKGLLIVLAVILGFVLIIAVTAIVVGAPPPGPAAPPALDRSGEALVKKWLVPPGSALEPRMEMERDAVPPYTPADAFRLGIDPAKVDISKARAATDAEAARLFGAVR